MGLADPTMDQKAKGRLFTLSKLAQHLKGKAHTRREQFISAFKLHLDPDVPCPLTACDAIIDKKKQKASGFIDHIEQLLPEQLWEDDTDAAGAGNGQDSDDEMLFSKMAASELSPADLFGLSTSLDEL